MLNLRITLIALHYCMYFTTRTVRRVNPQTAAPRCSSVKVDAHRVCWYSLGHVGDRRVMTETIHCYIHDITRAIAEPILYYISEIGLYLA